MDDDRVHSAMQRFQELGDLGLLISVSYGPCLWPGNSDVHRSRFSVLVMGPTGEMFDRPILAESFEHAIEIAEIEARSRGWLP